MGGRSPLLETLSINSSILVSNLSFIKDVGITNIMSKRKILRYSQVIIKSPSFRSEVIIEVCNTFWHQLLLLYFLSYIILPSSLLLLFITGCFHISSITQYTFCFVRLRVIVSSSPMPKDASPALRAQCPIKIVTCSHQQFCYHCR